MEKRACVLGQWDVLGQRVSQRPRHVWPDRSPAAPFALVQAQALPSPTLEAPPPNHQGPLWRSLQYICMVGPEAGSSEGRTSQKSQNPRACVSAGWRDLRAPLDSVSGGVVRIARAQSWRQEWAVAALARTSRQCSVVSI